jgi:hypothetical protein
MQKEIVDGPKRDEHEGGNEALNYIKKLPWMPCIGKVSIVSKWWRDKSHVVLQS